ncbi:MAG: hypothetical protein O6934_09130 [SAR324 cluster bacterium]|nr:hypothetical protein [SAR324 cluster bacterium]
MNANFLGFCTCPLTPPSPHPGHSFPLKAGRAMDYLHELFVLESAAASPPGWW